jgi:hypothetical protein
MTSLSSGRWNVNHPNVVHETIDGEVVVVNLDTGSYYSLEGVGAEVWALIETCAATDEIVRDVGRRYESDRPEVERVVVGLIDELLQEGLIAADETRAAEQIAAPARRDDTEIEKSRFEAPTLRKYTDMQELILLDPIHQVDDTGWPDRNLEPAKPE